MVHTERPHLNIPNLMEKNDVEAKRPASLLWLQATDPTFITPVAWEKGGMTRISFYTPKREGLLHVYRTVGKNLDGSIGLQDEVYPRNANNGVQFNYEVNSVGELMRYSESTVFPDIMRQCIDLIQPLVGQAGSIITS